MNSRYKRGWYGESYRHYLAAKGIPTKRYNKIKQKYAQGIWGFEDTDTNEFFMDRESAEKAETDRKYELERKRIEKMTPEEYEAEFGGEYDDEYDDADQADAWLKEYEDQKKLEKYGLPSYYQENESVNIEKEQDGIALISFYDGASPASEHPLTYQIRDTNGKVLWRSGITYMAEFAFEGLDRGDVTKGITEEAEEAFKGLLKLEKAQR